MEALLKGRRIRGRFADVLVSKGIATPYHPGEGVEKPAEKPKKETKPRAKKQK
jgi:hypothetical protein